MVTVGETMPYQPDEDGDVCKRGKGRQEKCHRYYHSARIPHEPCGARR